MKATNKVSHHLDDLDEMRNIMEKMLLLDETISARELARRHSHLSSASSFTRMAERRALLEHFRAEQDRARKIAEQSKKRSTASLSLKLAESEARVTELEQKIEILVASHVAMLRAVGEIGGFSAWAKFFKQTQSIQTALQDIGAVPNAEVVQMPMP